MRLGRTPRELLSSLDSGELGEIFAYNLLLSEEREAERNPPQDVEAAARKIFGRPK